MPGQSLTCRDGLRRCTTSLCAVPFINLGPLDNDWCAPSLQHPEPCWRTTHHAREIAASRQKHRFKLEAVGRPQYLGPAKDGSEQPQHAVCLNSRTVSFWLHSPAMRNASPYPCDPPLPQEGLMPDSCMLLRLLQAHQHDPKLESQSNCTMHTRSLCWRICAGRSF